MERGGKKFKKRRSGKNESMQPTKLDMDITKFLRFNVPRKSTVMQKQAVEYFSGSKAVDTLMDSQWAKRKKGVDQLFVCREDASRYLDELLQKKFFYRVEKIELGSKNKNDKAIDQSKNKTDNNEQSEKLSESKNAVEEVPMEPETTLRRRKKDKLTDNTEDEKNNDSGSNKAKGKSKKDKKPKDKEATKVKKRYKLIPHEDQKFFDSKDIYIWIYNPVGWRTIVMGIAVLLCVVAATLFPLWPPEVRLGVYYLSVAGGIFIGCIFGIALARSILYALIWLFTGGKHHLWILPNLLADVGFWESFKPYYTHEYRGPKDEDNDEEEEDDDEEEDVEDEDQEEESQNQDNENNEEQLQKDESLNDERKTDTGTRSEISTERSESES